MEKEAFYLLLLLTANLQTGLTDQCFQPGECRDSVTVGVVATTDEFACLDHCIANQECKWFTFSKLTNLCLLFNDCQILDEELCPDCLSGQQGCIPVDPVCNIQGYCSGVLDHFEELASLEDCLQLCQSSFGCRWVTYELTLSECLLYKTCPSLDESCDDCLSSERRCIHDLTTTTKVTGTTEYVTTTEDSTITTTQLATTTTKDVTTPSPTSFTKLAVFTGWDGDTRVFVIDLKDASNICRNLANVPVKVRGASGILFDSKPMFCGGYNNDGTGHSCECFAYEQSEWVSVAARPTCQSFFSGSAGLLNQEDGKSRFVIAGGYNGSYRSNVESYDGTSWQRLQDLPAPTYGLCMVAINDTVLLSIGGSPPTTKSFFYNAELSQWLPGPELLMARYLASCAMVEWKTLADGQLEQVVVVAGGGNSLDYLSSVELLYISNITAGWQPGPELPLTVAASVMVEHKNSVILVGGEIGVDGRHLYQLSSRKGPWIEMEQTLPNRKSGHIAFLIPDELADCQPA